MSIIQERRKRRNQNFESITDDPRRKALLKASREKLNKSAKSSSSVYLTETASETDAHYENALRKQYGDWSSGKLRELIGKNEAEINSTQNLALAKRVRAAKHGFKKTAAGAGSVGKAV